MKVNAGKVSMQTSSICKASVENWTAGAEAEDGDGNDDQTDAAEARQKLRPSPSPRRRQLQRQLCQRWSPKRRRHASFARPARRSKPRNSESKM